MSEQEMRSADQITCKRHRWTRVEQIQKPVLVRSNIHSRYYRWTEKVKCDKCGTEKVRFA